MASTRSRATVALVATLGVIAFSPASFAQDKVADNAGRGGMHQHRMMDLRMNRAEDGVYRLAGIACRPGAADRLQNRFDRIAKRLELTDTQKPLFDAFMTTALAAQTEFADACAAVMPGQRAELGGGAPGASPKTLDPNQMKQGTDQRAERAERPGRADRATRAERPDLIQGIEMRLAVDKARIDAMEKILPDLKALLASLTDAQKAKLFPFARGMGPEFRHGPAGGLDG
jgi:hypothetical protein